MIDYFKKKENRPFIFQTILIAAGFGFVYHKAILKLISDWRIDPNFSHGFLIPFVALYMVWAKKDELSRINPVKANSGLGIVVLGLLIHLAGNIGSEWFLMRSSMIITLSGIIIFCFGYKIFRATMVPVFYLIMMIPIPAILWNKIAFPLQLFSAKLSAYAIGMLSIPVFREGNVLHLANTSLEVVDACSGIRSLTSLLALTGAFAYLTRLSSSKKWILFLSAVPIAVMVNVIRLTITGMMAAWISPETAHGFLHDMSGLIVFGMALLLVYGAYLIEAKIENYQRKHKI